METALRQQVFVAGDPQRDQVLRGQARTIYNVCHQTFFSSPQPIDLSVSKSSYWAVRCNDDVATTDLPTWNAFVRAPRWPRRCTPNWKTLARTGAARVSPNPMWRPCKGCRC